MKIVANIFQNHNHIFGCLRVFIQYVNLCSPDCIPKWSNSLDIISTMWIPSNSGSLIRLVQIIEMKLLGLPLLLFHYCAFLLSHFFIVTSSSRHVVLPALFTHLILPVFASGQVGLQITGRLSVRPGQANVRQTWSS